jgi:hypothetical protein
MRQRENQSGFSAIEGLLIVLAIAVLAAGGLAVYQHNRVKVTDAAPNSNQTTNQQTTTTTTPNQNVVKIPELGIQITVPDSIKDLTYQVSTVTLRNGNKGTLATFSTTSLTAADASCNPSSIAVGSLEKASGQYPTASEDQYATLDYGQLVKQFPTFYISGGVEHQAGCSTSASAGSAAAATSINSTANGDGSAFEAALSTIQPLSQAN